MIIERIDIIPYHIPFLQTLTTATTSTKIRHGWYLELHTKQQVIGTGDVAPWIGFGGGVSQARKALRRLSQCKNIPLASHVEPFAHLSGILDRSPETKFGWEMAILDVWSQIKCRNMASLLNDSPKTAIEVSQLVSTQQEAETAKRNGISAFKVKIGRKNIEQDIKHVQKIRDAIGPNATLCADVNGKWDVQQAIDNLKKLQHFALSYVEQPIPAGNIKGLAQIRRSQPIAIAVDEGLTDIDSLQRHIEGNAIDIAVLKPMFLGGFKNTRQMAELAACKNIPVSVTSALESRFGRIATAHFCAATPAISLPFGLGTPLSEAASPADHIFAGKLFIPNTPTLTRKSVAGVSIPNPLASASRSRPTHTALIWEKEKTTFNELRNQVAALAYQLAPQVKRGSLIVLFGKPSKKWLVYWHALGWLGAIICPIDATCKTDELSKYLDAVQADGFINTDVPDFSLHDLTCIRPDPKRVGQQPEIFWSMDDLKVILFSSGSTGTPKPIPLRVSQLLFAAMGSALRLEHSHSDIWLCCLPLHHIGGLSILLRCTWYATTCVLHDRFRPNEIVQSISEHQVTQISLVPTMLQKLLQTTSDFPHHLRLVLLGGAAPSQELIEQCKQNEIPILLTWGMTESAAQIATTFATTTDAATCVGPPLPFATIATSPEGLIIHGPQTGNQPYTTNDLGTIDEYGHIWIAGRKDKVINSGGKLIDPKEIESVLLQDKNIIEAVVIGIPDQIWGEIVVAALVYTPAKTPPSSEQIRNHCKSHISSFKVPKQIILLNKIPRNQMGKIKYEKLVASFTQKRNNSNSHKV